MKFKHYLLPIYSLKSLYAINCQVDSEKPDRIYCDEIDQNLTGLDGIDWASFGDVQKLKLKLNDDEFQVNENYLTILEDTLRKLSPSLEELSLVHFNNGVTNKLLKKAENLRTLHVSKTLIDTLPERLFKDTLIDSFKIADSEINQFNNKVFSSSNLKKLKFEKNKLSSLDEDAFIHLESLEHLDLSDNNISQVHLDVMKPLKNLKKVDLDNNGLTFIPADFFKKNKDLRHLSLANNNLSDLPCDLLKHHYSLTSLNITNNEFTTIPCHVISRQGEQLTLFDASNNNIHDRYNADLSHKRGVAHKLNKKGMKANGKVIVEQDDNGELSYEQGNDNQISGTLSMVCDVCDRLPPRKKLRKKDNGKWEKEDNLL